MYRNFPGAPGHGGSARRSFRVEEEWMNDTLSLQETDVWRMSAKIHVVRSKMTVEGIYLVYCIDKEMRREAGVPEGKGVKTIVREALDGYGAPFQLGESYVAQPPTVLCLLLDSHWSVPSNRF